MSTMTDTQTTPEATPGQRFYGKYRGTVANNIDPMQMGRIQVMVPDVSNVVPTGWAMPCAPVGGDPDGLLHRPADRRGRVSRVRARRPGLPDLDGLLLGLGGGDAVGERHYGQRRARADWRIMLKSATEATIIVNDTSIYIQNGKGASIVMTGPTVTVNNGAMVIT